MTAQQIDSLSHSVLLRQLNCDALVVAVPATAATGKPRNMNVFFFSFNSPRNLTINIAFNIHVSFVTIFKLNNF